MLRQYIVLDHMIRTRRDALRRRFDERGATAVEYGLMVALIAVVIIVAVTVLGTNLRDKFQFVSDKVGAAGGS